MTRDLLLSTPFALRCHFRPLLMQAREHLLVATGQTAKSSPAKVKDNYYFPQNREQYQKFGYSDRFIKGTFTEAEFLDYLGFKGEDLAPKPHDYKDIETKEDFSQAANAVAKAIKERREHYLVLCLAFLADI